MAGFAGRVLVIDDDPVFLELVQIYLERWGYGVEATTDPRSGLDRAIEGDFDLILLDLKMPRMDGAEVLSMLKPLSLRHKVVMVSAYSEVEYRARARDLGAAAYLQKPLDPQELRHAVEELIPGSHGAETALEPAGSHILDRVALWVFDSHTITPVKRYAGLGVVGGLCGVLVWLVLF